MFPTSFVLMRSLAIVVTLCIDTRFVCKLDSIYVVNDRYKVTLYTAVFF